MCMGMVEQLRRHGAEIVDIEIPFLNAFSAAHLALISSEFALAHDAQFVDDGDKSRLEESNRITVAVGREMRGFEVLAAQRLR